MVTFAQPIVTLAPSAPLSLTVQADNPSQLSVTTGGSAGAVTSVNGLTGAVTITSLVNPMTGVGDTIYGGAAGVATRLAGNILATRKFLRELGDGVNSAAPVWDTLLAGDIPALPYVPVSSLPLSLASGGTGVNAASNAALLAAIGAAALAGATFTGQASPHVVALSQVAGVVAVNAAQGNDLRLTLTASGWTIQTPTNPTDGQVVLFVLTQDATGGRTVIWDTGYSFGAGSAPVLSGASKNDLVGFKYLASISKWCFTGSSLGF